MNSALFIAMCVLALLNIIVYTFVSSAIHKRDLCQKSPYYHCDTSWQCCAVGQDNCDDSPSGPTSSNSYKITNHFYGQNTNANLPGGKDHRNLDMLTCNYPGGANSTKPYYEACVQPIQVVMKNYDGSQGAPDFSCVYQNVTCDSKISEYLQPKYGVANFVPGQCCYQKFDADNSQNATSPPLPTGVPPQNLYPNSGGLYNWSNVGAFKSNFAQTPATQNFIYPVGSNTNTQNNSCNNSFFAVIPGAPYTPFGYNGCPGT
jgi:hypothetical protein